MPYAHAADPVHDGLATAQELNEYFKMIYSFDVMSMATEDGVVDAAGDFNITVNQTDNAPIERQRREFIHRLCKKTNIYIAPIEGGTRLACARALMTDTELPATTANKLTFPGNVSEESPIFTTRVAVSVYGPYTTVERMGSDGIGQGMNWDFDENMMIALKRVSQSYRDTLDASATSDVSAGYVELIRYARVALEETNNELDDRFTVDKEKHVVGTTPVILGKAKVVDIPRSVVKLEYTVPDLDMGPFEHLFNDYLPKIAKWWMTSYGKHNVKRIVDEKNKKEQDKDDITDEQYVNNALGRIKHYASSQAFWFKTVKSKSSQGKWTNGVPFEVMGLMNFAALCLGNEWGMHRASRFIDATRENAFKKKQRSVLDSSLLSKDKFLDGVLDMIRDATKVVMQKLNARLKGRRPIAQAFFAQAMAHDVFTFIETYGPDPFQLPHVFSEVLEEVDNHETPLYTGLLDMIFRTFPKYLDNVLPKGFESSCLITSFNQFFTEGDGFFPDSFADKDWDIGDNYIKYFTLESTADAADVTLAPLSLMGLAEAEEEELSDFYKVMVEAAERAEPQGMLF